MHDFDNYTAYAEYQSFKVDNEASQYRVTFSGYRGTAGKSTDFHTTGLHLLVTRALLVSQRSFTLQGYIYWLHGQCWLVNGASHYRVTFTGYTGNAGKSTELHTTGLHLLDTRALLVSQQSFTLQGYIYWIHGQCWLVNRASHYRVTFTGYKGNVGNGFELNNGMKFTTRDRDNDLHPYHFGKGQQGAWWYNACAKSSLNGIYQPEGTTGSKTIYWKTWRGTTLKATAMKIRPFN
ncbi:angiopoietin-related protein 1-like [Mytilus trossulus]|uniref:angiopoietin-related protein 1-like n=1 Tax=Mytilus trossulus TaxID=6551 RepID=UPI0030041A25